MLAVKIYVTSTSAVELSRVNCGGIPRCPAANAYIGSSAQYCAVPWVVKEAYAPGENDVCASVTDDVSTTNGSWHCDLGLRTYTRVIITAEYRVIATVTDYSTFIILLCNRSLQLAGWKGLGNY